MDLLYVAGALILCATILVLQRIVYPRATCGIFTRVSMLFILSSVWIIFKVITKEPVVTIAVVSVFYLCLMVGSRGEVLEKGIVALGAYLVAKVLTWIGVIVVGLLVYPFAAYGYYDVIVILGRVILHTIALIALAFAIKKSGFSIDIRHHTIATTIFIAILVVVSFCVVEQPFHVVGEQYFEYVLLVLVVATGVLITTTILDNKDGKKERKLITEHEQSEAGRRAAEAAHRAAVKVSHDIKEDLQKHLREYRMEAASDAAPELPGRVVAQTYRDMERRTSQELRDGKRLPRTGVSALDARLMRSLALAHGLDVDLDLMALAPIGGVVDGAARAAAACDNPVRRVLLTVDMAGDLFPSIRIESTSAQFPEPDILKAVSQLLSPGGVSIEISADMLPGDIYEKAVHLLFDGEGRRVGSGLSETAAV
ncbi:hypothetical protein GMD88_06290 [Pseudoflavonifractor sp. BIOML-A6]|nr:MULTISPECIES: hypothetical protein [unclassified Pseudoflavonifractor]MTQ96394.1 hypothetical protein [Pseudoflavonifractor sp. BIOML-A16]MTR05164.1 hypothetical protein [Pseudoflavonifractor sp. BIOML-A15]MTR32500.1 hypothetical protein [Pseudoflavonifractor sp. BIOML-A14]MTR73779.1 hypothetical protein [Pseudoflavonifractor sp. BIOML-A18]MTS63143.1 hypothetical protein [Pseudoflavonifractor sp. BIOML-A5]MTS70519.1 hypothetical protein [Pseudoflavonifractor sp. BIOML-A8]